MKKHCLFMIIAVAMIELPAMLRAQKTAPFSQINLALGMSTMGGGLELATPLGAHINARAGADVLPFSLGYTNYSLESYSDILEPAFGYVPNYRAKTAFNMRHGHLLADIHPVSRGIFHFTAGAYIGTSRIRIQGLLVDANDQPVTLQPDYEWPTVNIDGYEVKTDGGHADLDLILGNAVKPYLGIGLGNAVTNRGFGVKFELGALYQGDYTLKQNDRILNLKDKNEAGGEDISMLGKFTEWAKWWPMINLQFTFKLH
jgi:hypothetical protein